MARPALLMLALVCATAHWRLVASYPVFFARQDMPCDAHPAKQYAQHGAPVADSGISFTVSDGGKPVTSVCAGVNYTVQVSWGDPRLALLTASAGNFTPPPPAGDGGCPNRIFLDRSGDFAPADGQTVHLFLPCGANETEPLKLKATTARGARSEYRQGSASFKWALNCGGCNGVARVAKAPALAKAPPPMAKVAPMAPVSPMPPAPPPIARVAPIPKVSFGRRRV